MDLATFHWLLGAEGQHLLASLEDTSLASQQQLATLSSLRRITSAERAAAVYETALLRMRARSKFSAANRMYFTREALEQSSGELIAHYRAQRYVTMQRVGDLACGIGGDALGLAQAVRVVAVDRDPLRLAMAAENARALGLAERIELIEADLEQYRLPALDGLFFDPARRQNGRRVFALADYQPPIELVAQWRRQVPALGIKVAPGVNDDEAAALGVEETEFISVDGELKEATLWFGPLATAGRRATLIAASSETLTLHATETQAGEKIGEPGAFLHEPDPAVIRAHLVAQIAQEWGAWQFDPTIAYLSSNAPSPNRLARSWQIIEWLPFNLKHLRARLRNLEAGAVTVKKRGSPLDTDALARQLSGAGVRQLVVVLTKLRDAPIALICEGPVC